MPETVIHVVIRFEYVRQLLFDPTPFHQYWRILPPGPDERAALNAQIDAEGFGYVPILQELYPPMHSCHRQLVDRIFSSRKRAWSMEACATAHHWSRQTRALSHEVRLMPQAYVKAYLRRQKNDAADAEAICEAVSRPTMCFDQER